MVQDLSAPNSITVIAIEVLAAPDSPAAKAASLESFALALNDLGCVLTDAAGQSATIALEPDADIAAAINRLDSIVGDFDERHAPTRLRALIHFGTAFRAKNASGLTVFQGSALRSVSNSLRRSALPAGIFATADFASLVDSMKAASGFSIVAPESGEYFRVLVAEHRKEHSNQLHSTDPDLVAWLKARLARDLGPFAAALIDNASHSTRTAKELAAAVGHEIVNPLDRQRFDADVFRYLQSRNF